MHSKKLLRSTLAPSVLLMVLLGVLADGARQAKPTVHMVSHTHDDTGWLKTVDQYHYGSNNSIQFAGTQYILDSVVQALNRDKRRRFVYVEQAFFYRWWAEQEEDIKQLTRKLAAEQRLQFANGGWCMHDEAATYYIDMIDQTALGHRLLKNELNIVPYIGWQIDPFGHSATQASLISYGSGFLATYFGRADFQEYAFREAHQAREFLWSASPSVPYAELLGGILLTNHYGPPAHFHWDVISPYKTPIETDRRLHGYNVQERVDLFVQQAMSDAVKTLGTNIMWTMGDDFNYQDANMWFKNLDKLIKAVNEDGRVNAVYSTPLDYTLAKLNENLTFPTRTGDFFPYEDYPHAFWTGYYTSRAAFKRFVRDMSGFYTMARQINAVLGRPNGEMLPAMGQAMGLSQHHDAVTGTSKQHVVFDYAMRVHHAATDLRNATGHAIGDFLQQWEHPTICYFLNESVCDITAASDNVSVILWNQLSHDETLLVRIPVATMDLEVVGGGSNVRFQMYPSPVAVNNYGPNGESLPYLAAVQLRVPAVGFQTFQLRSATGGSESRRRTARSQRPKNGVVTSITNGVVTLTFDPQTGLLSTVRDAATGLTVAVSQSWCYYESSTGDAASSQSSGAYIFRPVASTVCNPILPTTGSVNATLIANGPAEIVVEQTFASWLVQRIRLPTGARYFEHEFTIGAIPIGDGIGKEVVSKFVTNISSNATMYTDSNGRELFRRVRNQRSYPFVQTEPIAGNYYPVNAMAAINDSAAQLSVLVDASNGGGSIEDGTLEVMVFRRILHDDGRGVGEPLNETEWITSYYNCGGNCGVHFGPGLIIRGVHTVTVLPTPEAQRLNRVLMDKVYAAPRPFFLPGLGLNPNLNHTFLKAPLDMRLQLTTLELLNSTTLLLRLAHQYAVSEDPSDRSQPITVNLRDLFSSVAFRAHSFEEYSLSANQKLDDMLNPFPPSRVSPASWDVIIRPMEVRTYLLNVTLE